MNKIWTDRAWADYLDWQLTDKKTLKKINERAFWGFKNLEAIILPDQLEEIGEEESAKQLTKMVFNYRITVYKWVIMECWVR